VSSSVLGSIEGRSPVASEGRSLVSIEGRSLVAIDGLDGSGKSRFARALAAACEAEGEPPVFVFRVDDFRRPLGALPPGADEAAVYYERYYDFALLDDCLGRFLVGAPGASIPRYDVARELVEGEQQLDFGASRVALVEGVFPMRAPAAARGAVVLLEVTEDEARRRILARDADRGRPLDVIEHRMRSRYFPAQRAYRAAFDPVRRADVVIDNERWDQPRFIRQAPGRLPRLVEKALRRVVPS
jgi:uridine kinase